MTEPSSMPSKPRRRYFQFILLTLLIVVMLAAGLLVAWWVSVEPYRRQRDVIVLIKELDGKYTLEPADKWLRRLCGDDFQNIVLVDVADCDDPGKYLEQVSSLPRLETLVVGGQNFSDENLSHLKQLKTLRGLVLDSTDVTDDGIGALKQTLPALVIHKSERRSIAALAQLSRIRTSPCVTLPQIRRLVGGEYFRVVSNVSLDSVKVRDADMVHLKGLTNLRFLHLGNFKVSDAGLAHLKGLLNLQSLSIYGTRVTDAGLAHLKGLTNLEKLRLEDTQVSDDGLTHLKGLTNLQNLNLEGTQVTDAGVQQLQKALPNCKISH